MPSLTEAAHTPTAALADNKEYESLTGVSGKREVLQVTTIFNKCVIRSIFMFILIII